MKRILICESGATKADWRIMEDSEQTAGELSAGMNVSTMTTDTIGTIIRNVAEKLPDGEYDEIHFYTAGVITPVIQAELEEIIGKCFKAAEVEIQTDLIASARAACGHEPGIAAIMGTGSNSCQWDGKKIVKQVRSGGFIIGDEGSASALGKMFISDFIKGLVPPEIAAEYAERFPHEYHDIVDIIYHNPDSPSGWLGSLCPFILSHYDHPYIKRTVNDNFKAFAERCLKQYDTDRYSVSIIGGFGNALKDMIRPVFEENGIRIRTFIPSPVEELIRYHTQAVR